MARGKRGGLTCLGFQVEGVSKRRRGIGGGGGGGSQASSSSSRKDRGLAVDFKESQVRGGFRDVLLVNCVCSALQIV